LKERAGICIQRREKKKRKIQKKIQKKSSNKIIIQNDSDFKVPSIHVQILCQRAQSAELFIIGNNNKNAPLITDVLWSWRSQVILLPKRQPHSFVVQQFRRRDSFQLEWASDEGQRHKKAPGRRRREKEKKLISLFLKLSRHKN